MTIEEQIVNDKRNFFKFFKDRIIISHYFLNAYFLNSLITPQHIRVIMFFIFLNLIFLLNAIFYTDDYLSSRYTKPQSVFIYLT